MLYSDSLNHQQKSLSLIMKTRNVCAGKARAMSEAQSGPSQVNKLTESVVSHIPFGDGKEVTIFQIGDRPLQDNVEEMEDSVPPSILGETSPMEKRLVMPSIETKCLKRDKTDTLPTIVDRQERVNENKMKRSCIINHDSRLQKRVRWIYQQGRPH